MKNNIIALFLIIVLAPLTGYSQGAKAESSRHKHKTKQTPTPPAWAKSHNYDADAHVYFPDYYTYYDPVRGGYAYWNNGKYTFTPALPPFLENVDLDKSRIKILKGLSLDLHPEQNYPYYMRMYPPDGNGNTLVPVPIPGNPAK